MAVTTSPAGRRGLAAAPLLALALGLLAAAPAPALAQVVYTFTLNGSNVEPPNGSPGTGTATVTLDPPLATRRRLVDINTMLLQINLSYLDSGMLAAQFHAPTPSPNTGTVGIAWSVPPGYGFGDTSFSLDMTYDMTDASYFNPTFVENNGGIVGARDALFAAFGAGTAYLSIETFGYPTGEIRGFSVPADPGGGADPHLQAFSGQSYEFCGADLPECKGNAFAVVSEEKLQVNAEVDRLAGADEWPAAGTWITGLGLRADGTMAVELRSVKDVEHTVVPDGAKTRALRPAGAAAGAPGLRALLASAAVNGEDVLGRIGSGETLEVARGHAVHFPAATHQADPTDGPVMVIETPDTTWTWYLESEDTWHLDFKVALKPGNTIKAMHGLLGQSLHWTPTTEAAVEGGDDLAYIVADGLLGADFKYSLFGKPVPAARRTFLELPLIKGGLVAGTPAGLAVAA